MMKIKSLRPVFIIAAVVVLLELFVFNFRHWQSVTNSFPYIGFTLYNTSYQRPTMDEGLLGGSVDIPCYGPPLRSLRFLS